MMQQQQQLSEHDGRIQVPYSKVSGQPQKSYSPTHLLLSQKQQVLNRLFPQQDTRPGSKLAGAGSYTPSCLGRWTPKTQVAQIYKTLD